EREALFRRQNPGAGERRVQIADPSAAESPDAKIAATFARRDKRERRFRQQPHRRIRISDSAAKDRWIEQIGPVPLRAVHISVAGAVGAGEYSKGGTRLGQENGREVPPSDGVLKNRWTAGERGQTIAHPRQERVRLVEGAAA